MISPRVTSPIHLHPSRCAGVCRRGQRWELSGKWGVADAPGARRAMPPCPVSAGRRAGLPWLWGAGPTSQKRRGTLRGVPSRTGCKSLVWGEGLGRLGVRAQAEQVDTVCLVCEPLRGTPLGAPLTCRHVHSHPCLSSGFDELLPFCEAIIYWVRLACMTSVYSWAYFPVSSYAWI